MDLIRRLEEELELIIGTRDNPISDLDMAYEDGFIDAMNVVREVIEDEDKRH